jgi:predicted dehydrogenase
MKKTPSSPVRLGIIGIGGMGSYHARNILDGKVPGIELAAVADASPERRALFPGIPGFADAAELIASGTVQAVLIVTPHYSHTPLGTMALKAGLHVMMEKPISVHKADCERLLSAHTDPRLVFGAMFNQRTDPFFRKIRDLVRAGELGEIRRVNWTITDWFRPDSYFGSGGWRATWAGEGGGVLLNQCLHNLDIFQWIFGMPSRVHGFCGFGRYHKIEVEDDVTAYFEFPNGATSVFITSTGEAPGTNRLEIAGERGRLVYEKDTLRFDRNEVPMSEFARTSKDLYSAPATWDVRFPISGHGGQHSEILQNFADAILHGAPLIAPAKDGIHSVELANAIILSAMRKQPIEFPLDAKVYERQLKALIAKSKKGKGK